MRSTLRTERPRGKLLRASVVLCVGLVAFVSATEGAVAASGTTTTVTNGPGDVPGTDGYLPPAAKAKLQTSPTFVSPKKSAWLKAHPVKGMTGIVPDTTDPGGGSPASAYLPGSWQRQWYSNYCGPATLVETLAESGHLNGHDQAWAASVLNTGPPGGSGTSGGEIGPALNAYSGGYPYDEVQVTSPYSGYVSPYIGRLKVDVLTGYGLAAVGDMVAGGPHLHEWPNIDAFHFFNIDGYSDSGNTTHYEDSAVGWVSGVVDGYSSLSSDTIVRIISGRPYYW